MMYAGGMGFGFFWIIPVIGFTAFLFVVFLRRRHNPQSGGENRYRSRQRQKTHKEMPEEILRVGQEVLENLDWEIRFLEKQRLGTADSAELTKIGKELKSKKEEYQTVVERLDLER